MYSRMMKPLLDYQRKFVASLLRRPRGPHGRTQLAAVRRAWRRIVRREGREEVVAQLRDMEEG